MYSRNGAANSMPALRRTSTPSAIYDDIDDNSRCDSEFSFSEYMPLPYNRSSSHVEEDEEYSFDPKRSKFNSAQRSFFNRSRTARNDIENLRESSLAAIRESQLTRMESEIGLIQFNLNELKREMMRLTGSSQQDRKTTQQLQQELRNADRLLKQLEEEELTFSESARTTPNRKKGPTKTSPVKLSSDTSNHQDESVETERLIQDELDILKRIYSDNLEFLLVVLKEMKFITTNSARMECLDFLSQIRKREESEIERLKSPKKNISFCGREANSNSSRGNITSGDSVSVTTSLRVGASSDAGNDDLESVSSEFDDNRSVNELMTMMNAKVEDLITKLANEKSLEDVVSPISKGDVIHLCREIYSLLNEMSVESDIEIINSCFDVLELYIVKDLDEEVQEEIVTDLMDILTTFLFFYRAVGRLLSQAEFVDEKLQREYVEQRFEKLREKKDRDLESILTTRAQLRADSSRKSIDQESDLKEGESRKEDGEEASTTEKEEQDNVFDNLMTLEELMYRDSLENNDNDTIETKEEAEDVDETPGVRADTVVSGKGIVYSSPKTVTPKQSTPQTNNGSPSQQPRSQKVTEESLRPFVSTINEDRLKEMMEKEGDEMDMQFLLKVGSIKASGVNQDDRDYAEFASNYFSTN